MNDPKPSRIVVSATSLPNDFIQEILTAKYFIHN